MFFFFILQSIREIARTRSKRQKKDVFHDRSIDDFSVHDSKLMGDTKVTRMQRPGTGAIKTQIPRSSRELTKITNSQNTKKTYGQPSEQLFPER